MKKKEKRSGQKEACAKVKNVKDLNCQKDGGVFGVTEA